MEDDEKRFWFTIGDLKKVLEEYPEDMPVVVSGLESGFENFYRPEEIDVVHVPDNYYKDGEFQIAGERTMSETYAVLAFIRNLRD